MPQIVPYAEKTIKFKKTDDSQLILTSLVIQKFIQYQQDKPYKYEAGGLLLGRHLKDCSHLAVDYISEPQRGDKRSRCSFFRGKGHQKTAHKYWHNSGGTCAYLGSWHTHPEPYPTPSQTDINDWLNVLKNDVYEGSHLYFVIVGTKEIACWEGTINNPYITKLTKS